MTPIHYTTKVLSDGHLPLPENFPARAGDSVSVTVQSVEKDQDGDVGLRQRENGLQLLAGKGRSGKMDVSERHDDYLYPKPGSA